ncbi:unnamed protein product, partial [Allacma fusca]
RVAWPPPPLATQNGQYPNDPTKLRTPVLATKAFRPQGSEIQTNNWTSRNINKVPTSGTNGNLFIRRPKASLNREDNDPVQCTQMFLNSNTVPTHSSVSGKGESRHGVTNLNFLRGVGNVALLRAGRLNVRSGTAKQPTVAALLPLPVSKINQTTPNLACKGIPIGLKLTDKAAAADTKLFGDNIFTAMQYCSLCPTRRHQLQPLESTLFMGIKVQILSSEGHILITQIEPSATVESVKQTALSHFYPTEAASSNTKGEHFRIIHPAQSRTLNDSHVVQEEKVLENDILLFVKRRENKHLDTVGDSELKAPTLTDINAATNSLPPASRGPAVRTSTAPQHESGESTVDFQLELRKIIISLVSLMSTLLHGNTEANLICKEMHTRLKHRLTAAAKPHEGITMQLPPPSEVSCTPMGIIHGLAEAKKREFRPNQKAFESLREMGFADEDICNALRACKNNKDHACEWLLSGGGVVIDDVDTGLDQNSHLFNALVTNPTIRLGLNCPKTLLAFLGILESPASANMWLQDSDTAPVLSAIFKIYHSEKHAAPEL